MKWLLFISIILFSTLYLSSCSKDNDPINRINPTISIYTKSSALDFSTSGGRNGRVSVILGDDWAYDELIYITVLGIRTKISGISLNGDLGDPGAPTEAKTPGNWELFSDSTIVFDLKNLQELMTTENSRIISKGDLNSVRFKLEYIELDVVFKGIENTIRVYWKDDEVAGARAFDILIKDSNNFKWIDPINKTLHDVRPEDLDSALRVFIHPLEIEGITGQLILDHFANLDYINEPPPWTFKYEQIQSVTGRLNVFYTINDETTSGKEFEITLDLSFRNSLAFKEEKGKGDLYGIDSTDENRFVFYTIEKEGDWPEIYDLDSNSITSPEFDIYDLLPGLSYPAALVHVSVDEVN